MRRVTIPGLLMQSDMTLAMVSDICDRTEDSAADKNEAYYHYHPWEIGGKGAATQCP
jgi:hypothetical protein